MIRIGDLCLVTYKDGSSFVGVYKEISENYVAFTKQPTVASIDSDETTVIIMRDSLRSFEQVSTAYLDYRKVFDNREAQIEELKSLIQHFESIQIAMKYGILKNNDVRSEPDAGRSGNKIRFPGKVPPPE